MGDKPEETAECSNSLLNITLGLGHSLSLFRDLFSLHLYINKISGEENVTAVVRYLLLNDYDDVVYESFETKEFGDELSYSLDVNSPLPSGTYKARVVINYKDKELIAESDYVTVKSAKDLLKIPFLIFLIILIIIFFIYFWLHRRPKTGRYAP